MIAKIHTTNQIPAIGSGVRIVHVESKGPKWARIRPLCSTLNMRIRRSTYDEVVIAEFADLEELRSWRA